MYKVIIFNSLDGDFWAEEIKDFDDFCHALSYAVNSNCPYEIFKDYFYVSAVELVARSSYDLWSRN